jgi:methionine-rich copper-binding protein CopC
VSPRIKFGLLTLVAATILPVVAHAHAILEDSQPPSGGTVKAGAVDLHLRFNSRIDRGRSRLTLIRPDHGRDTIGIAPAGAPEIIDAHVNLTPGAYIVRWQVLAVDGHITRGDIPITVTAP